MKQNQNKKHFYLVYGEVKFTRVNPETKKDDGQTYGMPLNGIISNDTPTLPAAMLGRAQQTLQMHLAKQAGDDMQNLNIVDVLLFSISYLGEMTDAEFQAGHEDKEPAKAKLSLIPGSDSVQ